jgi:regulator of sigma E protease
MIVTLLVFLLILSVLVYVHEFGHFFAARRNGVRVYEFAFGFRPRLWAKKIGQTEYAINAIPLGGYVRLYGEQATETGPESFRSKSIFQRFQILVAGALMNLILAWVVLSGLFMAGFDPLMPGVATNPFISSTQEVTIVRVLPDSPALAAGLRSDDVIRFVNGEKVASDQEFIALVSRYKGETVDLVVSRAGQEREVSVLARENPPAGEGALGVGIRSAGEVRSTVLKAPLAAFYETGRIIGLSAQGVVDFGKNLFIRGKVSEDVTGLIGIGALTGVTRRLGLEYLLQLVAVVSIGLGVINLFPILPLDGGHIAALGYEKVAGRPLTERQLGALAGVGLALVFALFVIVTYKDIVRFQVLERIF